MDDKVMRYVEAMHKELIDLEAHLGTVHDTAETAEREHGRYPMTSALRTSASHALNLLYQFLEAWDVYRYTLHSVQGEAALAQVKEYEEEDDGE